MTKISLSTSDNESLSQKKKKKRAYEWPETDIPSKLPKNIVFQSVMDPEIEGKWVEMRDSLGEIVFRHSTEHYIFYPYRDDKRGVLYDKRGYIIDNFVYSSQDEDSETEKIEYKKRKKNPKTVNFKKKHLAYQLAPVRSKIIENLEEVKKTQDSKTLVKVQLNDWNIEKVKNLQLNKDPMQFIYLPKDLRDINNQPLFIELRDVHETSSGTKRVLKTEFWYRSEMNSQPTRLLRRMLRDAGESPELWNTSFKKARSLRAYQVLGTKIEDKVYLLQDVIPQNVRKTANPKKPIGSGRKEKKRAVLELSLEGGDFVVSENEEISDFVFETIPTFSEDILKKEEEKENSDFVFETIPTFSEDVLKKEEEKENSDFVFEAVPTFIEDVLEEEKENSDFVFEAVPTFSEDVLKKEEEKENSDFVFEAVPTFIEERKSIDNFNME